MDKALRDPACAQSAAALGTDEFERLEAQGVALSLNSAVEEILAAFEIRSV